MEEKNRISKFRESLWEDYIGRAYWGSVKEHRVWQHEIKMVIMLR